MTLTTVHVKCDLHNPAARRPAWMTYPNPMDHICPPLYYCCLCIEVLKT